MVSNVKRFFSKRQARMVTVAAVALSFFLSGLVVASNLPGATDLRGKTIRCDLRERRRRPGCTRFLRRFGGTVLELTVVRSR